MATGNPRAKIELVDEIMSFCHKIKFVILPTFHESVKTCINAKIMSRYSVASSPSFTTDAVVEKPNYVLSV